MIETVDKRKCAFKKEEIRPIELMTIKTGATHPNGVIWRDIYDLFTQEYPEHRLTKKSTEMFGVNIKALAASALYGLTFLDILRRPDGAPAKSSTGAILYTYNPNRPAPTLESAQKAYKNRRAHPPKVSKPVSRQDKTQIVGNYISDLLGGSEFEISRQHKLKSLENLPYVSEDYKLKEYRDFINNYINSRIEKETDVQEIR